MTTPSPENAAFVTKTLARLAEFHDDCSSVLRDAVEQLRDLEAKYHQLSETSTVNPPVPQYNMPITPERTETLYNIVGDNLSNRELAREIMRRAGGNMTSKHLLSLMRDTYGRRSGWLESNLRNDPNLRFGKGEVTLLKHARGKKKPK